ncbi:phospholipase D-like domain-containing protein [Streptomyces sp. enrichment culture]|uniref:phospholipase D-like domain-containing protein n=1 Tax=Streptomyces sp. enrichment culture TaxID=1795815 RepID=UPI003F57FC93
MAKTTRRLIPVALTGALLLGGTASVTAVPTAPTPVNGPADSVPAVNSPGLNTVPAKAGPSSGTDPQAAVTAAGRREAAGDKAVINGPVFNDPLSGPGSGTPSSGQSAVIDQLVKLIDAVPADGTIRLALHEFKADTTQVIPTVTNRLIAAHQRGASVQIILNSTAKNEPVRQRLAEQLGEKDTGRSWVVGCGVQRGCLARNYLHAKFATFSKVVWPDGSTDNNVVFQSSSNLTDWYLFHSYNDAYTLSDAEMYTAYARFFEDLRKGRTQPVNPGYGWTTPTGSTYRALFHPREQTGADPMVNTLRSVKCSYTENGQRKQTDVRIAMLHFNQNRAAVAEELLRLRGQGCWIDIVHAEGGADATVASILDRAASNGQNIQRRSCRITTSGRDIIPHTKVMMIDGAYDDDIIPRVYTGSANFTHLENSDDSRLRIMGRNTHNAYLSWFYRLRSVCGG